MIDVEYSLQYRELMISSGTYPVPIADNLVPGSDMAGEVLAVGDEVTEWQIGDRVCANFSPLHIYGDLTPAMRSSVWGCEVDGVLTQYKLFSKSVRLKTGVTATTKQ
jgi:NADPH:quinone reductase-like Zn-dependent oxidoreductase